MSRATLLDVLRLVFRQPGYALAALLLFALVGVFYAWAAQVLIVGPRGLSVLVEPDVIATIVLLAALFAVTVPLQVYAAGLAMAGIRRTGGTLLGLVVGTVSMSCCAPVLLPGLLSLAGFSGTAILSLNVGIHRYFVPLALLGAILLVYSALSTVSSLSRVCVAAPAAGVHSH
jgi:hypothetical protein